MEKPKGRRGFSLVELLAVIAVLGILSGLIVPAVRQAILSSSLATSSSNLRQLAAGTAAYLSTNNHRFWPYRQVVNEMDQKGITWWFGYEDSSSFRKAEGERRFDPMEGPLAGFVPGGINPDPSFGFVGKAFKPKYQFGYIGIGYNVLLGGGWSGYGTLTRISELENPGRIVVFATSAQVNTFQGPASSRNPMIEEFYGIDDQPRNKTVHFRHQGKALVTFADSSLGFLPMAEGTADPRDPEANVGRLESVYLQPRPEDPQQISGGP